MATANGERGETVAGRRSPARYRRRYYFFSVLAFFSVVFFWAFVWNILLFRGRYEELAGSMLREPPFFASGMTAIFFQAVAMTAAFALFYPAGRFQPGRAILIAAIVNAGSVTYGAFVVPGKFNILDVVGWIPLELAHGVIATCSIGIVLALVWSAAATREKGAEHGV
ncbi:MAG: hypothetical protein R3C97_18280 [Geminicoccaceae bacterium]